MKFLGAIERNEFHEILFFSPYRKATNIHLTDEKILFYSFFRTVTSIRLNGSAAWTIVMSTSAMQTTPSTPSAAPQSAQKSSTRNKARTTSQVDRSFQIFIHLHLLF